SSACTSSSKTASGSRDNTVGKVALDVPEIGSQEIAGEWLIPKDGILLVSFGPHTVASKDGKAVIHERLAIIEAEEAPDATASRRATWSVTPLPVPRPPIPEAATAPSPRPTAAAKLPMSVPALPSRSIPQGVHV